jgi:hypothetical protein
MLPWNILPKLNRTRRICCVCSIYGKQDYNFVTINFCDSHKDTNCWNIFTDEEKNQNPNIQYCCGDNSGETWESRTLDNLDIALPQKTCVNGSWYIRDQANGITSYNLWNS